MQRLMHPKHGFCIAYTASEQKLLESLGWLPDDGKALAAKLAAYGVVSPLAPQPVPQPAPQPLTHPPAQTPRTAAKAKSTSRPPAPQPPAESTP